MIVNVWDWKNNIKAGHDIVLTYFISNSTIRNIRVGSKTQNINIEIEIDVWITEEIFFLTQTFHITPI